MTQSGHRPTSDICKQQRRFQTLPGWTRESLQCRLLSIGGHAWCPPKFQLSRLGKLLMTRCKTTKALKFAGINVLLFFVFANIFYWAIPTISTISKLFRSGSAPLVHIGTEDGWVPLAKLTYKSFVGWRGEPVAGQTLNVEGPYRQRRTINAHSSDSTTAYFFGGSTMWGFASPDGGTIPSQFSAITGIRSENFGELAWTAHQSLMLLIQLIQNGHRPDLVVFYDGVNEIFFKCVQLHNAESHGWESQIIAHLNPPSTRSFAHYFAPLESLALKIQRELRRALGAGASQMKDYAGDCHQNLIKAKAIAENLIHDWQVAKQLVTAYGGKFVGILQPVAFFSRTRVDQLGLQSSFNQSVRVQYDAIYPLLIERLGGGGEYLN